MLFLRRPGILSHRHVCPFEPASTILDGAGAPQQTKILRLGQYSSSGAAALSTDHSSHCHGFPTANRHPPPSTFACDYLALSPHRPNRADGRHLYHQHYFQHDTNISQCFKYSINHSFGETTLYQDAFGFHSVYRATSAIKWQSRNRHYGMVSDILCLLRV